MASIVGDPAAARLRPDPASETESGTNRRETLRTLAAGSNPKIIPGGRSLLIPRMA